MAALEHTPRNWILVTLHGGPLNELRRHVRGTVHSATLQHPDSSARYVYARDEAGVWRYDSQERPA